MFLKVFCAACLLVSVFGHRGSRSDDTSVASLAAVVSQQSAVISQQAAAIQSMQADITAMKAHHQADITAMKAQEHADITAMKADLARKETEINALNSKMADLTTPVIMSVFAPKQTYSIGQIIKFSSVLTDTAHMLDTLTGIATIPHAGSYWIYLRVDPSSDETLTVDIKVNSVQKATAFVEGGRTSSVGISLRLNQGDRVWADIVNSITHTIVEQGTVMTIMRISP